MSTSLENLTDNFNTAVNDQVYTNLIDAGVLPDRAYQLAHGPSDGIWNDDANDTSDNVNPSGTFLF